MYKTLISIKNEQKHHNKIAVIEAPRYLAI